MTELPKVLHVEDDSDIREIACLALEAIGGLSLVQCASGPEALSKAQAATPDVLLLDVMMPGMSGVETLAELRKLPGLETTPAVFMTARAQLSEVEELRALGAVAVITKPFDAMTLAEELISIWRGTL
ncbi:response regulator [Thalassovita taeanensis]|uniref:Response regulator receiver domain-containing protein n=1 Tax=Thalassovita taeanensis TaxID=657014 RepID=A0A1H9I5Q9_9RHOB|nr:response regulator [Thalassovita taeanensis]SEQ69919.1 Response regulator receiver domain-containing protein [Thalassovita taeanensis]